MLLSFCVYSGPAFLKRKVGGRTHLSYKKGVPKNFPQNTPLYFGEAFEVPRDFSRKVLCVGVGGRRPNIQCLHKKRGIAAFFYCRQQLELRSKPCFKVLLKKRLKNPQNFCTDYTTLFWQSPLGRVPRHYATNIKNLCLNE